MEEAQAVELVGYLIAAYPTPAWEKPTIRLWREELVDLDHDVTTTVVRGWIRTHDQRPTIATIRRGVAEKQLVNAMGSKLFLPPDEAWEYVRGAFGSVGRERPFPTDHPLVAEAVARIGWVSMCNSENQDVLRGQFRIAYTALLERSIAESAASSGASSPPEAVTDTIEAPSAEVPRIAHGGVKCR